MKICLKTTSAFTWWENWHLL